MTLPIDANTITFDLLLTVGKTWPQWVANHPHQIVKVDQISEDQKIVKVQFFIDSSSKSLSIKNCNKFAEETIVVNGEIVKDQCLIIDKAWVNDIFVELGLLTEYYNFYPEYREDNIQYAKDHNIVLDQVVQTRELYFNGTWTLTFERPFFIWYNQILLKQLNKFNKWVQASHLGIADDQQLAQLTKILEDLN